MEKFLDRELQRQLHRSDFMISNESAGHHNPISISPEIAQEISPLSAEAAAMNEEAERIALLKKKKVDDDFIKLEQSFMSELALARGDLPSWMLDAAEAS